LVNDEALIMISKSQILNFLAMAILGEYSMERCDIFAEEKRTRMVVWSVA